MFRFVPGRVLYVGAWFFGFSFSSVDHKCLMLTQLIFMPSFFFQSIKWLFGANKCVIGICKSVKKLIEKMKKTQSKPALNMY